MLAQDTGTTLPQVYLTLRNLSQRHILQFIPQKKTPYVRYMQRREDSERLLFPPMVYEELKQRFIQRIRKMTEYASGEEECRSRVLLRYFGEEQKKDCGTCDVCTARRSLPTADARKAILQFLADRRKHPLADLRSLPFDTTIINESLRQLTREDAIIHDDGLVSLRH